ncbi:MAG TPA: metallophosphoesterase [Candidatus Limnocylindria bacterium]|nr:metallophosphoesterase [Candidatus Limnocylindria bacterium]
MARDAAAPDASSNLDNRVRAHSVVVTLLILTVGFTLVGQLSDRLAASSSPSANASPPGGSAGGTPSAPGLSPTPQPTPVDHRPQFIYAAGDIADCPDTVPAVPDLVRIRRALILAVGDIVYPSGAARGFKECFDPLWGDLKARIRPVPGNHDYKSGVATGYYDYFGAAAGDVGRGWYSFDMGTWHIIAINSMCQFIGGCRAGSPQLEWLAADLAAHPAACTLAFWHHPRFSSGNGASPQRTEALWQALYAAGAEVVLNGHDHDYERFTPMDPTGQVDLQRGIREFVVGTGGANLTRRVRVAAHSEIWTRTHHGLLEMTLRAGRYDWRFIAAETRKVVDAGSGTCH